MAIRLILVCNEGPAKQAYLREAASIGIEVDAVATFGEFFKAMLTMAYQGILLDLVTSVKSTQEEKGIVQEILDVFPLLQLKWDPETNTIHTISRGMSANSSTLAQFVARECQPFKPSAIRLNVRKSMNFNILICKQEAMTQANTENSVTLNISKGGCFLFSCQDWSNASNVWFAINELKDKTPINGEIRWRQSWGISMAIPGIGVSIKQLTSQQRVELIEQYSLS